MNYYDISVLESGDDKKAFMEYKTLLVRVMKMRPYHDMKKKIASDFVIVNGLLNRERLSIAERFYLASIHRRMAEEYLELYEEKICLEEFVNARLDEGAYRQYCIKYPKRATKGSPEGIGA